MKKKFNIGKETKTFTAWIKKKYTWIDSDVRRMLFKSWCARARVK